MSAERSMCAMTTIYVFIPADKDTPLPWMAWLEGIDWPRDSIVAHLESLAMATQALPVLLSAPPSEEVVSMPASKGRPPSSRKIFLCDPSHHHSNVAMMMLLLLPTMCDKVQRFRRLLLLLCIRQSSVFCNN